MRNGLNKTCRETQNTRFMFNIFFPENRAVYEVMSKNKAEPEGLQMTSKYGPYALHAGYARLHPRTRMHTYMHKPKRPSTRTYAHTHTHTHTHTQICNIYCFSTATIIRELVSMLRKSHIACLIIFNLFYFLCTRNIFVTWFLNF
jgi:hypothetical protein